MLSILPDSNSSGINPGAVHHAHAIAAPEPAALIRPRHYTPKPKKAVTIEEPAGPTGYDTGLTADEGLWLRRGWGGRS